MICVCVFGFVCVCTSMKYCYIIIVVSIVVIFAILRAKLLTYSNAPRYTHTHTSFPDKLVDKTIDPNANFNNI